MFGALTGALGGGGGGLSASSSSSNEQKSSNQISSGTITVGGLNLGSKSAIDSDLVIQGAAVVAIGLGAIYAYKKIK